MKIRSKLHHQLQKQLRSRSHVWWFKFPWNFAKNSFLKLFMASRFELCFKFAQRLGKNRLNMDSECIINFNKSTILHAKLVISLPRDLFILHSISRWLFSRLHRRSFVDRLAKVFLFKQTFTFLISMNAC